MSAEKPPELVKLVGVITNYKVTRTDASFVFTENDRSAMGMIAIAAAISGLSGPAIAVATNVNTTEEDADYIEFDLDDQAVKGWVWRSPFSEGDEVEIAAEWRDDHYEAAGITRPVDRIIALYPHCSRGRARHLKNSMKWWFFGTTFLLLFIFLIMLMMIPVNHIFQNDEGEIYVYLGVYLFFGLMTVSLTRKWMPFARLAEKVFVALDIPDPSNVDLAKSTKAQRKPDDPGELGTFYFRY